MKKWWALSIVTIGTIGILAHIVQDAFVKFSDSPLTALTIFKYFTVQSNLIAVVYFWLYVSLRMNFRSAIFNRFMGAVVVYISITFIIFMTMLESIYEPEGLNVLGSILLHYINPVLIIGFFIYNRKDYSFTMKQSLTWIIYPLIYLVFLLIHDQIAVEPLYPFLDVTKVGIDGVIYMILGLFGFYFLLSFVTVKIVSLK